MVTVIRYRPGERPCRWLCLCVPSADVDETADTGEESPDRPHRFGRRPSSSPVAGRELIVTGHYPRLLPAGDGVHHTRPHPS
ncbi:DUF6248 family natural product biosynthesis protein [Streptomyces chartreusis]